MNTYTPQPLDTSVVTLPPTLTALMVKLAENTHDVWAVTRIAQGWTYGPNRDDAKQHACLVPYGRPARERRGLRPPHSGRDAEGDRGVVRQNC